MSRQYPKNDSETLARHKANRQRLGAHPVKGRFSQFAAGHRFGPELLCVRCDTSLRQHEANPKMCRGRPA